LEGRQGCSSGASTDLRLTVGISRTVVTLGVEWRFPGQSVRFLEGSENSLVVLPRMARSDKQRTLETAPDRLDVTTQRGEHSSRLRRSVTPGAGSTNLLRGGGAPRPQGRGTLTSGMKPWISQPSPRRQSPFLQSRRATPCRMVTASASEGGSVTFTVELEQESDGRWIGEV